MSTIDESDNVLNDLQAYLNQYSVDDSLLSDSSEFSPGTFVSQSPLGLTPRLDRSAKNSPRLIKQSSTSVTKGEGDPVSPKLPSPSLDGSSLSSPRFSVWNSEKSKNTPKLIRQSSTRSSTKSITGQVDLNPAGNLVQSVPNGSARNSPGLIKHSAVDSSSLSPNAKVNSKHSTRQNIDTAPRATTASSILNNDSSNEAKTESGSMKAMSNGNAVLADGKPNSSGMNRAVTSPERKSSHLAVATSSSKGSSNTETIIVNSGRSGSKAQVAHPNPSISGDGSRQSVNVLPIHKQGILVDTREPGDGNSLNRINGRWRANTAERGAKPTDATSGKSTGEEAEGRGGVSKEDALGNKGRGGSNLGPDVPQLNLGKLEAETPQGQTVSNAAVGRVGGNMGNKQAGSSGKTNIDSVTIDDGNFSFGYPSTHLVASSSDVSDTKKKDNKPKSGHKKKKSKGGKSDTSSNRNSYYGEDKEEKPDMYEIHFDDDLDNGLDESNLTSPSPAVPELIVDVLKADVSSDKADGISTPSVDEVSPHTKPKSNRAETTADESGESTEINKNDASNDLDKSMEEKWRTPDDGMHYPIIYRRSKKDPGSKQYNELVKELSSVLEKRAQATRTQSMREEKSGTKLGVEAAGGGDGRRISKSSENVNIFANKSLLSKLENHLMSKNVNNKLINNERKAGGKNDSDTLTSVDFLSVLRKKESKNSRENSSNQPSVTNSAANPAVMHNQLKEGQQLLTVANQKSGDTELEPVYAVSNKGPVDTYGKRVSAKLIYDHSTSFSKEDASPDLSFLPDDLTGTQSDHVIPATSAHLYSHHAGDFHTRSNQDKNTTAATSSSFQPRLSQDHVILRHGEQQQHEHHLQQSGHSLSWAHINVDGRKSTTGVGTILSVTPDATHHTNTDRYDNSLDVRHRKSRPLSSSATMGPTANSSDPHRYSMDDNWRNSQGHFTTIQISGDGLRRRSKIMYSDTDLSRGFTVPEGVTSFKESDIYHHTTQNTESRTSIPSYHPAVIGTGRQYKGRSKLYHSYDNLRLNSSFEGKHVHSPNTSRANISFDQNQSYDISFGNETFEEDELRGYYLDQTFHNSSDTSFSTTGSHPAHLVKVNVQADSSGISDGSSADTYFINASTGPSPAAVMRSSSGASAKPRPVSMTTIVEHSRSSLQSGSERDLTTPSWASVIDNHGHGQDRKVRLYRAVSLKSSSSSNGSSRSKIARSHILEHNIPTQQHQHVYRKLNSRGDLSFTSDRSVSSYRSTDLSSSQLFVVIPPQPRKGKVPDLIVDHQQIQHVKQHGSPFHQEIGEGVLPTAHGEGLYKGEEDKPATFVIDARNIKGEPTVQVDGPNAIAKCSIDPLGDGQYKVTYIPVEVGLFDVYVRWNGKELPASPYHPKVVDARKVKVVGGWQHYMDGQERVHLVVGEEKMIPFDTSEAGPGQLRAEVSGPSSNIPVEVDNEHNGRSVVKFTPIEEGVHYIRLYWSDHPLVNSPYPAYATGGVADPSKVRLTGRGLKEAVVQEEAEFIIDGSQAGPGEPDVVLSGVKAEIPVFTTALGGGKFRCTYIPTIPGAYLLNISWNNRQLKGAPYKVNVINASHPERVVVNGEGLRGGLLGNSLDFRIDTRKAGPGELTAYCMGPSKVAYCELSDHHDGTYRLVVRPQETGRHMLQIKYGGEHVQGSPYPFKVSAQPDASKVRVSGPGVEHGILANFQSQFIVETKGAGAGQLTVRIRGPKGAFQVEMYRESQKDRTILCRYYPSVTGLYIINVRWSGVDVPGSPFHVQILDTQQELEQVLHEQSFSGSGHHQLVHANNSFHNTSMNSGNQMRYTTTHMQMQNSHHQHHNVSQRSSGYYQWREGI